MTLVITTHGKDFVVLGADSRGIVGALERERLTIGMDQIRKLMPITEHVGILKYGIGEFGESLLERFREEMESGLDGVTDVTEKLRVFCKKKWSEWFSDVPPQMHPDVGFMVAGLDRREEDGKYAVPRTYSMIDKYGFAPAFYKYGFACEGVTLLAMYILNKQYQENMTQNDLCTLVAYAISETASVDKRVGGPIRIAVIDPEGYREIPEETVLSLIESVTG